jgi:hypothetical protein
MNPQAHGGAIWPVEIAGATRAELAYLVRSTVGGDHWEFDIVGSSAGQLRDLGLDLPSER